MPADLPSLRLVQVEWLDHCEAEGPVWTTVAKASRKRPARMLSVGWLVGDDNEAVRLSHSVSEDDDTVSRPLVLARGCVLSVTDLA